MTLLKSFATTSRDLIPSSITAFSSVVRRLLPSKRADVVLDLPQKRDAIARLDIEDVYCVNFKEENLVETNSSARSWQGGYCQKLGGGCPKVEQFHNH